MQNMGRDDIKKRQKIFENKRRIFQAGVTGGAMAGTTLADGGHRWERKIYPHNQNKEKVRENQNKGEFTEKIRIKKITKKI